MRTCVACRARQAPQHLLRFALDESAVLRLDMGCTAPGRGAWSCVRPECLRRAVKRGSFARSFRRRVTIPTIENLEEHVAAALLHEVEAAQQLTARFDSPARGRQVVALARERLRSWMGQSSDADTVSVGADR